jgi:hypothetical protein
MRLFRYPDDTPEEVDTPQPPTARPTSFRVRRDGQELEEARRRVEAQDRDLLDRLSRAGPPGTSRGRTEPP